MLAGRRATAPDEGLGVPDSDGMIGELCAQRIEFSVATDDKAARTRGLRAMSRRRVEIAFSDFGELLRILFEIGFVAIQQLGQGWAGAFINDDAIPFLIPCKLGKDVRKVLEQFGPLGGRQGPNRIFNLLRGAHPPKLSCLFPARQQGCDPEDLTSDPPRRIRRLANI
jgi:hypothetical protein